jgi:hypothetical protein
MSTTACIHAPLFTLCASRRLRILAHLVKELGTFWARAWTLIGIMGGNHTFNVLLGTEGYFRVRHGSVQARCACPRVNVGPACRASRRRGRPGYNAHNQHVGQSHSRGEPRFLARAERAQAEARMGDQPATAWHAPAAPQHQYDPSVLRKLRKARSWKELRTVLQTANSPPDAVDLCTALHCAQNLLGVSARTLPVEESEQLRHFVRSTVLLMLERCSSQHPQKGSQTISNALTSLARLHYRPNSATMAALCARALHCIADATPQALANTALGLALLRVQPEEEAGLLDMLMRESLAKARLSSARVLPERALLTLLFALLLASAASCALVLLCQNRAPVARSRSVPNGEEPAARANGHPAARLHSADAEF